MNSMHNNTWVRYNHLKRNGSMVEWHMDKSCKILFAIILACMLGACPVPEVPEIEKTITGTVTITIDDLPYDTNNYLPYGTNMDELSPRVAAPPGYCPLITMYPISPIPEGLDINNLGSVHADGYRNEADLATGTFNWSMKIFSDRLPCDVYFTVEMPEDFINHVKPTYVASYKSNNTIWISKGENKSIDIGTITINYRNIQLSGNLPVTINGEPLTYNESSYANMYVYQNIPYETVVPADIQPNGDWSINAFVPASTEPLKFRVMAVKNGGKFRQDLIPNDSITTQNIQSEVFFPDHSGIDFKAHSISGTVKLIVPDPNTILNSYSIRFIDKDLTEPYNYSLLPSAQQSAWDNRVATVYILQPPQVNDGIYYWETMIPDYSFPHDLIFSITARLSEIALTPGLDGVVGDNGILSYITISGADELNNINLGTFYVKRRYFKNNRYTYAADYLESFDDIE